MTTLDPSGIILGFPDPMLLVDPDGTIVAANPRAGELFRYPFRTLVGKELGGFLADEDDAVGRYLGMCRRTSDAIPGGLRIRLPDGEVLACKADGGSVRRDGRDDSVIWLRLLPRQAAFASLSVLDGRLRALSASERARVERKRAAEELRQSEERFRLLVDSVHDYAIFMLDLEGCFASWNPGAQRIKGYRAEEILGRHYSIFYPPEDVDRGIPDEQLREALLTSRVTDEGWRIRKDGSRFWANGSLAAIRNGGGNVIGFAKITRDLTERRRAEEAVRESEARTRLIFDTALDAVMTVDEQGVVQEWNPQAERMFGWRYDEVVGRRISELIIPHRYRAAHENGLRNFLATGAGPILNRRVEITAVRQDGHEFPVELSVAPYRAGEAWLFSGFVHDITERKRAEASLRESEQRYTELQTELAHASRLSIMGQLTASIAHEVAQPLAAARTNASAGLRWLKTNPPNVDEISQALERIVRDVDLGSAVVTRIRDMVKSAPETLEETSFHDAIEDVLAIARSEVTKHGVKVRREFAPDLPPVKADRVQIEQVLLNLIVNAIDAMSEVTDGKRELVLGTEAMRSGEVCVFVRDTGPGIDPAAIEKIFQPFHTTKEKGLGMGLSICRSIMESHGGKLWAAANTPRGAVFQFTLPAAERSV